MSVLQLPTSALDTVAEEWLCWWKICFFFPFYRLLPGIVLNETSSFSLVHKLYRGRPVDCICKTQCCSQQFDQQKPVVCASSWVCACKCVFVRVRAFVRPIGIQLYTPDVPDIAHLSTSIKDRFISDSAQIIYSVLRSFPEWLGERDSVRCKIWLCTFAFNMWLHYTRLLKFIGNTIHFILVIMFCCR